IPKLEMQKGQAGAATDTFSLADVQRPEARRELSTAAAQPVTQAPILFAGNGHQNRDQEAVVAVTGVTSKARAGAFSSMQTFVRPANNQSKLSEKDRGEAGSVLASFTLEQNGPQMRVVDNDGSVYAGVWESQSTSAPMVTEASGDLTAKRAVRQ